MGLAGTVAAAMGHRVTLADIESPALLFARLNTLPYASRAYVRKLNWQTDNLGERFDLILGAECCTSALSGSFSSLSGERIWLSAAWLSLASRVE